MRPVALVTLLIGLWVFPGNVTAQDSYTQKRTQEIVASFNKEKHKVKEVYGVRREKYKKVLSEPVIKQNIRDYSGVYEVPEMGFLITIQVESADRIKATGTEPTNSNDRQPRSFRLDNAKIAGAMLTGTKVYGDGSTEKFEGVFINVTVFESPTDKGVTTFGLGAVGNGLEFAGLTWDKLFYHFKH